MSERAGLSIQRWTPLSAASVAMLGALGVALAFGPLYLGANAVDRLTTLYIYVILGVMWNALAGYGGLVSVGQQAFFGIGAYAAIRLSSFGLGVYPALVLGAALAGLVALALSSFALRLRGGEFGIGMWVIAELFHLLVNLDRLIQGETGTSLIALNSFAPESRRDYNYWLALASMAALLVLVFSLLRGRLGSSVQAIRDSEDAAASLGVRVLAAKRILFVVAGAGCGLAGSLPSAPMRNLFPICASFAVRMRFRSASRSREPRQSFSALILATFRCRRGAKFPATGGWEWPKKNANSISRRNSKS